ncbi:MAG: hypothetical protein AAF789_09845, partial [Bacteroidota bacterium]
MIEFAATSVKEVFLQKMQEDQTGSLIQQQFSPLEEETLKKLFLKPFTEVITTYAFHHPSGIEFNVLKSAVDKGRDDQSIKHISHEIITHLKNSSQHANIKQGEVFILYFSQIGISGKLVDGIGIFKAEKKSYFLETPEWTKEAYLTIKEGLGDKKLDKASLVLFTENDPTILAYDNNSQEAVY